jgi:hypothetical protein
MITIDDHAEGFPVTEEATKALMHDVFSNMAAMHRRLDLLRAEPTPLNATVYVTLSRDTISDETTGLEEFIEDLRAKAAEAPDGCPVVVSYEKEYGYEGDSWVWFEIGYERLPTDEEKTERKARNAEIRAAKKEAAAEATERERAEFKRLQAKFASDSGSDRNGEDCVAS